jgi:hypothetical protein
MGAEDGALGVYGFELETPLISASRLVKAT